MAPQETTAIYIAGSSSLEPGRRYVLAIAEGRFRVLGPVDGSSTVVALDRPISGMEATTVNGRLVISETGARSGIVLAFMGIAGINPAQLAADITHAGLGGAQSA